MDIYPPLAASVATIRHSISATMTTLWLESVQEVSLAALENAPAVPHQMKDIIVQSSQNCGIYTPSSRK